MTLSNHVISRRSFAAAGAALCATGLVAATAHADSPADAPAGAPEVSETVDCDFLIIGSGIGGMSAALEAKQLGVENVVVLEKNSVAGGSTLFAEGIFATHSRYQEELGIPAVDATEVVAEEAAFHHHVINTGLMKAFVEASSDNVNWLLDQGVGFVTVEVETCGGKCLHIYNGGNGTHAIEVIGDKLADEYGMQVTLETRAVELIQEEGTVVGAVAERADGTRVAYRAPLTLLATGGMGASEDMMDEYTKLARGKWRHFGAVGQDGDGQRMAEATAMGRAKNVCAMNMWLNVDGAVVKSTVNYVAGSEGSNIWVNEEAARFCDESISGNPATLIDCNNAVHAQGRAYSIFDSDHVAFFREQGTTADWSGFSPTGEPQTTIDADLEEAVADPEVAFWRADSIEELAGLLDLDPAALADTVAAWNAEVEQGEDADFGKDPALMFPVSAPPFYAARLTNGVLTTVGGIRVNARGEVCAPDGTPVPGLRAAGVCCAGFTGEIYSMTAPGTAQGSGVFLGRLAAQAAAQLG